MPKHLVLFSDGTGNSAGKLFKTNVWRVYSAVDLTDPQQLPHPRQFAFYDDGVGTSSFKPLAVLGGAFGVGLSRNVLDLYVFLCRTYKPGDRIYAFGFSRGAFTMRVLIGLVMTQGLIKYNGDESDLQRLAKDAYRAYRAERFKSLNPVVGLVRTLRAWTVRGLDAVLHRTPYARAERVGVPDTPEAIKVDFLGLWDTVDAYGLPVDELTRTIDYVIWPLTMRDYNLNPRVLCARHALALDDERNAFHPRLWNEQPDDQGRGGVPGGNLTSAHTNEERISQVWFAGMHSNVGGGYPDDSLSYVPLEWIMREAQSQGLRFKQPTWAEQQALSDENGPIYDSRRGLAGYYRYNPRRIERLTDTPKVKVGRTKVHESVLRRIRVGHDGYAPITLPPGFAVMKIDGSIVDGDSYLDSLQAAGSPVRLLVSKTAPYVSQREHVYNWVWRRRVAYFMTLAATLALVLMPLFVPGVEPCAGRYCFWVNPISGLGWLLPSFASFWIDSFATHPVWFLALLSLLVLGLGRGSALQRQVDYQMRRVWYAMPSLNPPTPKPTALPEPPNVLQLCIERLRSNVIYRSAFRLLTHAVLPVCFLVTIVYVCIVSASQLAFSYRASTGGLCAESAAAVEPGPEGIVSTFDIAGRCVATGVLAERGASYRVRITVPVTWRWSDASIPAGPHGFSSALSWQQALMFGAAVPLRRHPTEPWFQPMARIGSTGNDTYVLRGATQTAPAPLPAATSGLLPNCPVRTAMPSQHQHQHQHQHQQDEIFEATVVARSSGPLYLYLNDAVDLPLGVYKFYDNNQGCARVQVSKALSL